MCVPDPKSCQLFICYLSFKRKLIKNVGHMYTPWSGLDIMFSVFCIDYVASYQMNALIFHA